MKRFLLIFLFLSSGLFAYCDNLEDIAPVVYDQGFIHPYGMVAYKNMILVSNYGYENSDGKCEEGKGYICAIQAGVVKSFIRADGHLTAPKGMAIYENFLFVADVGKIVVYNLKKIVNPPLEINFPSSEIVLTDVEVVGSMLLVSVNDTGKIFGIDLRGMTPSQMSSRAELLAEVPGAGGMAVYGTKLFVNSFSSEIADSSLVYVGDLTSREEKPFKPFIGNMSPGQYLGIDVSEDNSMLFLSSLKTEEIYRPMIYMCPLDSEQLPRVLDAGFDFKSPTAIMVHGGSLWILDHLQNKVYRYQLN